MHFQFEGFILVISELETRVEGQAVDCAWTKVNQVCENYLQLIFQTRNALYRAMGSLTLKAWDKRVNAARNQQSPYLPAEPPTIFKLSAQRIRKESQTTHARHPSFPDASNPKLPAGLEYHHSNSKMQIDTNSSLDWTRTCISLSIQQTWARNTGRTSLMEEVTKFLAVASKTRHVLPTVPLWKRRDAPLFDPQPSSSILRHES